MIEARQSRIPPPHAIYIRVKQGMEMKNPNSKSFTATVYTRCNLQARAQFSLLVLVSVLVFLAFNLLVSPVSGQNKFEPEDPQIQEMIKGGLRFIEANQTNLLGPRVMFGMAAYKGQIVTSAGDPKKHVLIEKALAAINDNCTEAGLANSAGFEKMYASALACVFLLELDGEKYKNQIEVLLDHIHLRQQDSGSWGYKEYPTAGDTSQIQYIALAFWLARQQEFDIDNEACRMALKWLVDTQQGSGGWWYQQPPGVVPTGDAQFGRRVRHSLVAAGLGSVYLFADMLKLTGGSGNGRLGPAKDEDLDLPPDVIDITNEDDQSSKAEDRRALVSFDKGSLNRSIGMGNNWFKSNFTADVEEFNLYYLYGFERYAALREYVEGSAGDVEDWYDQGVDRLMEIQNSEGGFSAPGSEASPAIQTAFAVLFLTRSMSITIDDNAESIATGGKNFESGALLKEGKDDKIISSKVNAKISSMLEMMENPDEDEMKLYEGALKGMKLDESSRSQQLAALRGLVKHEDARARLIGVKFLSRQRALDNVPAFIFALSDPEPKVAVEAHKALKFVSRKTSVKNLSGKTI